MIDLITQEATDFDWFFCDFNGLIGHVASAGGRLPNSIANNEEVIQMIFDYFFNISTKSEFVLIETNIQKRYGDIEISNTNQLFRDFVNMSKKGLFSFDKLKLNDFDSEEYILIAKPQKEDDFLNISMLPDSLREALMQSPANFDLRSSISFLISEIR